MKFGEVDQGLATAKQIEFIKSLCEQLGYDEDAYNFATMMKKEAADIIKDLLEEQGR